MTVVLRRASSGDGPPRLAPTPNDFDAIALCPLHEARDCYNARGMPHLVVALPRGFRLDGPGRVDYADGVHYEGYRRSTSDQAFRNLYRTDVNAVRFYAAFPNDPDRYVDLGRVGPGQLPGPGAHWVDDLVEALTEHSSVAVLRLGVRFGVGDSYVKPSLALAQKHFEDAAIRCMNAPNYVAELREALSKSLAQPLELGAVREALERQWSLAEGNHVDACKHLVDEAYACELPEIQREAFIQHLEGRGYDLTPSSAVPDFPREHALRVSLSKGRLSLELD